MPERDPVAAIGPLHMASAQRREPPRRGRVSGGQWPPLAAKGTPAAICGELQIGQVARQTGHTVVTLRHWEKLGLLDPPPRRGGKRRYPPSVLTRIAVIDLARRAGFGLAEIRELLSGPAPDQPAAGCWRALATRKLAEIDSLMACLRDRQWLLEHLLACQCASLEDCLSTFSHADMARGLEEHAASD